MPESPPSEIGIGVYPGGTNPAFIHLTGTIVSWWARIEGLMVNDIWVLRTHPECAEFSQKRRFPLAGKEVVKHWRELHLSRSAEHRTEKSRFDLIVAEALDLVHHRNTLVHSFWPYGQTNSDYLELHWVKPSANEPHGVERGTYTKSVEELNGVNQRLANLYTRVMMASMNSHLKSNRQRQMVSLGD